jgi:hypothetical protein
MTPEAELEWHRHWRKRLLAEMRRWWKPPSYAAACDAWSNVEAILKEQPEQAEEGTK